MTANPGSDMVLSSTSDGVATITLNRARRHNSLVPAVLLALVDAVDAAESRDDVRAMVLRARGASFSTGGDVRAFLDNEQRIRDYAAELVGRLNEAILRLIESRLTVIVAVDGQVTGGALGLVLAGDIVVVTKRASFTPYYSVVGFSPDGGWTAILPDIIGRGRTAAVLAANLTISAEQAMDWGIASHFVGSTPLEEALAGICARVLEARSGAVRAGKRLLAPAHCAERLEAERQQFVRQVGSDEALAGIRAFLDRGSRDSS